MNTVETWGPRALATALVAVMTACGGGGSTIDNVPTAVVATVAIEETGVLLQEVGETRHLSAVVRDAQGNALDVPIAWSSGKPAVIAVDAVGKLTATSAAGSSQILASAQGVLSAPLLAIVAQPAAGAMLINDAQVLGEPVETDPNAVPSMANTYRVTLSGVAAPALGTLLVGTGSKPVAGRVVAADTSVAGQTTVTLALVPLPELLPTLQIDEVFDLSNGPVIYPEEVLAYYTVERVGNTHTFTPKPAVSQGASRERALAEAIGTRQLSTLGPFECDLSATGLLGDPPPLPVQLTVPPAFSVTVGPSLATQYRDGRLDRIVLKAEPTLDVVSELKIDLVFQGKFACKVELFVFPVPVGGVLSYAMSGLVGVGAGFDLGGKLTVAQINLAQKIKASSVLEAGLVDCRGASGCKLHGSADGDLSWDPKWTLPSAGLGGLRFEPALEVFGTIEVDLGSRLVRRARWKMLKTKFGGKIEGNFATTSAQVLDAGYQSNYKLSLEGSAGVGVDLASILQVLGLESVTLLELKASTDLATSPAAAVSADRVSFNAGETVNLKAVFDPSTFLGLYNIERIEWVHRVGSTQTTIATQNAISGQTEFAHVLTASDADAAGEYLAFVIPAFPALPLEVGNVSLTFAEPPPAQACPLYEVDVGGRIGNSPSRVFNVNAEAGFSAPGAYGAASLGGNLTLSLTSAYAGTALARGNVTYLVEMDSPGESIESIWRWSVRSNVGEGGSCSATLSVGGATRTITATNNNLQVLEIPVSVRHGDVLQAKLDAVCSSPGLLPGPPEVLVNANIGSTIDIMGIPGGRFRAVMCIP
jgi:hypothetical protein